MVGERRYHTAGMRREDGAALRGTFIIDPDGVIRHLQVNEVGVGRNVEETLRTLCALRTGERCPVTWRPGEPTPTAVAQGEEAAAWAHPAP